MRPGGRRLVTPALECLDYAFCVLIKLFVLYIFEKAIKHFCLSVNAVVVLYEANIYAAMS